MNDKTLAVISLVLAFLFPIAGLILGIVALVKISRSGGEGKGLALAAVVIGILLILLLLFLISVGGLAYFGVMNPAKMLPERCTFPAGIVCADFKVTSDSVFMGMQNGMGRDITITGIGFTGPAVTGTCQSKQNVAVKNSETVQLKVSGCNIKGESGGARVRIYAELEYIAADSLLTHKINGDLIGTLNN